MREQHVEEVKIPDTSFSNSPLFQDTITDSRNSTDRHSSPIIPIHIRKWIQHWIVKQQYRKKNRQNSWELASSIITQTVTVCLDERHFVFRKKQWTNSGVVISINRASRISNLTVVETEVHAFFRENKFFRRRCRHHGWRGCSSGA